MSASVFAAVDLIPRAIPKSGSLIHAVVRELPHVSDVLPFVIIVVFVVVNATCVAHWLVPTFALLTSSNWHKSIAPEPCPDLYHAFMRAVTPLIVEPSGIALKSKPIAFKT